MFNLSSAGLDGQPSAKDLALGETGNKLNKCFRWLQGKLLIIVGMLRFYSSLDAGFSKNTFLI